MKNSLTSTRTSDAVLRLNRWIFPVLLASCVVAGCGPQAPQPAPGPQGPSGSIVPQAPQGTPGPQGSPGPQPSPASQSGVVGQWRTVLQGSTYTITIDASGQYMQLAVPPNGGMKFAQGGPYQLIPPNIIAFTVTDWSPKTRTVLVPCGDPSNPVCNTPQQQPIPQPSNSSYAYRFNGPNTLILSNPNTREVLTFTRAAQ